MSAKTPRVWEHYVEDPQQSTQQVWLETPAWFRWLEVATTHSFTYPVFDPAVGYIVGFMTVRKERRQRGGAYWIAYRRCQGQVRRKYLGASRQLTRACLEQQAQAFLAANAASDPAHD
jgi:LuxR family maltose regulon positive regulatory protein